MSLVKRKSLSALVQNSSEERKRAPQRSASRDAWPDGILPFRLLQISVCPIPSLYSVQASLPSACSYSTDLAASCNSFLYTSTACSKTFLSFTEALVSLTK